MKVKHAGWIFMIFLLSSFGIAINKGNKADQITGNDRMAQSVSANNYASLQQDTTKSSKADPKSGGDRGIGPVKNVKLGPIDPKLVKEGHNLYSTKCMICHDLNQRKVGPPLGDVTKTRTPEFIMNLLLNTVNMERENPTMEDLISQYHIPMTSPGVSQQQARAVLEYLRSVAK